MAVKVEVAAAICVLAALSVFGAEGFFSVRQKGNGVWTFVDPDGKDFFLRAVDHVGGVDGERKNGPIDAAQVKERMAAWGFNTIGVRANSRQPLMADMPWLCYLKLGATLGDTPDPERGLTLNLHIPATAMPNVFRKDFEEHAFRLARMMCAPLKDNRQLVGYCLDNELAFQGRNRGASGNWGLFEAARTKPETNSAHVALMDFLASKGIASTNDVPMPVREEFCRLVAHKYFDVLTRAVRAADPNHLILGCRFSAHYDWTEEEAGKFVDVITVNCYPSVDLDRGIVDPNAVRRISRIHEKGKKPVMVTEWSFPAADTGYRDAGPGAGQRFATQAQRTRATEIFARTMLAMPYLVGYSYFMWQDSPAGSREETNYGLLDRNGNPFPEITGMFARLHAPESLACARPDGADLSCDGKKWRLTVADGLEVRGVIGGGENLFRTKFRGVDFGFAKVGMVLGTGAEAPKLREGFPVVFPRVSVVKDVRFETLDGWRKSLRLTGEGAWNDQKFEIAVRAVLLEGAGKVRFEIVSIRNVGNVPLLGVRALLQHYPPFKKIVKSGRNIAPPAPDFPVWGKPSVAEITSEDGSAALRCVSDAKTLKSMYFSVDGAGNLHPDVFFAPWCEEGRGGLDALRLSPGETYRPASPMYDEVELRTARLGRDGPYR